MCRLQKQDNDPKHTAKKVLKYIQDCDIALLDWPSQSPDLNPIENLWQQLNLETKMRKSNSKNDLLARLQDAWAKIDKDVLEKLVLSMLQRCQAVIDSNGFPTKY